MEPLDRKIDRWSISTRELAEEIVRECRTTRERATRCAEALEQAAVLVELIRSGLVPGVTIY